MGYPGVTDTTACAFAGNRAFVEHDGRSEPLCTAYHTDNKNGRGTSDPRNPLRRRDAAADNDDRPTTSEP
jgi:hypothetical protein